MYLVYRYFVALNMSKKYMYCERSFSTVSQEPCSMRLTRYTDYAMRVLIYLGVQPDKVCSIAEIARAYGISHNHLMKVAHDLGRSGYVESVRGRTGGVRLARSTESINVG